jgi:hypothetical protein
LAAAGNHILISDVAIELSQPEGIEARLFVAATAR